MGSARRLYVLQGSMRVAECGVDHREGSERKMPVVRRLLNAREQPGRVISLSRRGVNPGHGADDARLGFGTKQSGKTKVLEGRGILSEYGEGSGRRSVQVPAMRVQLK